MTLFDGTTCSGVSNIEPMAGMLGATQVALRDFELRTK